ncbi:MAG: CPBP family intramembrane metalloprotease [Flavobacteriales bacterium]|nr:CPBP family intramembrane metalloprotease [Flavobacteriales bacterium]
MDFLFRIFPFTRKEVKELPLKPIAITVVTAFSLIGIRYFSGSHRIGEYMSLWQSLGIAGLADQLEYATNRHPDAQLWDLVYWASVSFCFYVLLPVLVIKLIFRENISDYGLKIKGMLFGAKGYLLMATVMFPVVVMVSFSPEFVHTYPFYRFTSPDKLFPQFFIWEVFYILQFFSLEFFFRGFMVLGLKKHMGAYSILAMTVPYCMIHFSKPLPECIGSIFAGLILGAMSYRTGSVWLGAALHVFVALTMDLLSLWHRGII